MKAQIEKTIVIKMTLKEAEKLSDAIGAIGSSSRDVPDWAKDKIEELHEVLNDSTK